MTLYQHIDALEAEAVKRSEKAKEACDRAYADMLKAELALIVAEDMAYTWPKIEASVADNTCEACNGPATEDDRSDVFDCLICRACHLKALEGWKRFNLGTDPPLTLNERINRMYERNTYKHLRKGNPHDQRMA